jgi:hypothetical protein
MGGCRTCERRARTVLIFEEFHSTLTMIRKIITTVHARPVT